MAFRFQARQVADPAAQLNFEQLEGALETGITGPAGPTGPAGADGADGANGADGAPGEKWFTGSGAPSGTLTGSIVGDWYLDSATGDYYEKTATTTWTLRGNLKGATGATGPAGPATSSIVAGRVNSDGTIAAGTGFTITKTGTGTYTVTISSGTLVSLVANAGFADSDIAITDTYTSTSCRVVMIHTATSAALNRQFSFIAFKT